MVVGNVFFNFGSQPRILRRPHLLHVFFNAVNHPANLFMQLFSMPGVAGIPLVILPVFFYFVEEGAHQEVELSLFHDDELISVFLRLSLHIGDTLPLLQQLFLILVPSALFSFSALLNPHHIFPLQTFNRLDYAIVEFLALP